MAALAAPWMERIATPSAACDEEIPTGIGRMIFPKPAALSQARYSSSE